MLGKTFLMLFSAFSAVMAAQAFGQYWLGSAQGQVYNSIIGKSDYSRLVECLGTSPRGNLATYFWHLIQIPYKRGDVPA